MAFQPEAYKSDAPPLFRDKSDSGSSWTPIYWHKCSFPPQIFEEVMWNLIKNPNINSSHLFRADILLDRLDEEVKDVEFAADSQSARVVQVDGFILQRVVVRKLIPRNTVVDKPLVQTCLIYSGLENTDAKSLVIYLPHISSPSECPFYHPAIRGMAFLHVITPKVNEGGVSLHFSFFQDLDRNASLDRIAYHLLEVLHKHGQGKASGYIKQFHHDAILPQAKVQDTYSILKSKYGRDLCKNWVEKTDPTKHVFEDLSIAAFLIELWKDTYSSEDPFPGFVDIGCGNGLLVNILIQEGYFGWGFDARKRKSWETYSPNVQNSLKQLVLIPSMLYNESAPIESQDEDTNPGIHNGQFSKSFIISNHADELTPWTPILANISQSAFIMIPCCSHNLAGSKFRAPAPKTGPRSAYASLVSWATDIAEACGWQVEKDLLRIPSTRNVALVGRHRSISFKSSSDTCEIIENFGGAEGLKKNVMKLVKIEPRGH